MKKQSKSDICRHCGKPIVMRIGGWEHFDFVAGEPVTYSIFCFGVPSLEILGRTANPAKGAVVTYSEQKA